MLLKASLNAASICNWVQWKKLGEQHSLIFTWALSLCRVSCKESPLLLLDMKGSFWAKCRVWRGWKGATLSFSVGNNEREQGCSNFKRDGVGTLPRYSLGPHNLLGTESWECRIVRIPCFGGFVSLHFCLYLNENVNYYRIHSERIKF
jgi:hypothetical protein